MNGAKRVEGLAVDKALRHQIGDAITPKWPTSSAQLYQPADFPLG
jgi:hypothetical protein